MASSDVTDNTDTLITLESDSTQRTYSRLERNQDCLLRVENVGSAPAVLGYLGATLSMDPDSPDQQEGERLLPAGSSVILTRGTKGFVHKSTTGTLLAIEDATE